MTKFLIFTALFITLTACNGNDGGSSVADDGSSGGTNSSGTLFETPVDKGISNGGAKDTILGVWESEDIVNMGVVIKLRIKFTDTKTIATTGCFYNDGVSLYAQVSSSVRYPDDSTFEVLQNSEKTIKHEQNGKSYDCSASLSEGSQTYNIINGTIVTEEGMLLTKIAN